MTLVQNKVKHEEAYLAAQGELEAQGPALPWLTALRREGMERFLALGFPTTKDEDWRFTNLAPIASRVFALPGSAPALTRSDLEPFLPPGLNGWLLVFVDGRWSRELSNLQGVPKGVILGGLADALERQPRLVEPHLQPEAQAAGDAFTALNDAFVADGAFVHVPQGLALERPVHVLFVSSGATPSAMTHPRNIVVAEQGSRVTLVEDYVSLDPGLFFTNSLTRLTLGDGATGSHYLLVRDSLEACNVSTLRSVQGSHSELVSHSALLGGALVRNNVMPTLAGEGASCLLNGLYVLAGRQHADNFMRVEHAQPQGQSRQFYRGVLDGESRGVFSGRIIVRPGAQKTDAKQTNANLLLSDSAGVDTLPQLEIYADDVKCTHGATIGQIDPEALFYLQARGIDARAARDLVVFAFANESLGRMKLEPIRSLLEKALLHKLPGGPALETWL